MRRLDYRRIPRPVDIEFTIRIDDSEFNRLCAYANTEPYRNSPKVVQSLILAAIGLAWDHND